MFLKKTLPFLKIVSKLPLKSRKKILKETKGDKDIYKSFREMSVNVLDGNLKVKKLKPGHIKFMKSIVKNENKTSKCTCAKRSKFNQNGAGILSLLIPAITALTTLLAK